MTVSVSVSVRSYSQLSFGQDKQSLVVQDWDIFTGGTSAPSSGRDDFTQLSLPLPVAYTMNARDMALPEVLKDCAAKQYCHFL